MVLSGYLHGPLPADAAAKVVLMVHGRQDAVVPLVAAQRTRDRLQQAGISLQYQEFDMGHEITAPVLEQMQAFIRKNLA
jgi:phospholipase/carboxylesterase